MKQKPSKEEQKTLEAYQNTAVKRSASHAEPDFWLPELKKFKKMLPQGKIIEIGCGGGRDALFLNERYEYIGIDNSNAQIKQAKKLVPNASFQVMSVYDLNFSSQYFDGFWATALFLHMPKDKIISVLQGVKNILKPGAVGFIAIKEGEGERMISDKENNKRFFAFYKQNEFSKILENAGFQILETKRDFRKYNPPKNMTVWLLYFVKVKK